MMALGFRQSQSVLHTWSGLIVGWILFLIFLAGTVSYWRHELTRWMRPELGLPAAPTESLQQAQAFLQRTAPNATEWVIDLPGPRLGATKVSWKSSGKPSTDRDHAEPHEATLSAFGWPVNARATYGGDFFYRLHFDLHYVPVLWARWFVCLCTMFMLVAILSGVITHKRIFADFFTFRRGKGQRSWLDGHNALAVVSLPFHLMITYTGLITLMTIYMPWPAYTNFGTRQALLAELFPKPEKITAAGVAALTPNLSALALRAEQLWGVGQAGRVRVEYPNDAAMRITISRSDGAKIADREEPLRFDSHGVLADTVDHRTLASASREAMIGLHAARFSPLTMRWLFFLSGVTGTLMVVSGLVLWTVKRRAQLPDPTRPHVGFRLVERLNVTFIAGLPLAMLGMLWANRLLPTSMTARADWEVRAFFITWTITIIHSLLRSPKSAWREQFRVTGVLAILLPMHNYVLLDGGVITTLAAGDGAKSGIDVALAVIGCVFLLLACAVGRKERRGLPGFKTRTDARAAK